MYGYSDRLISCVYLCNMGVCLMTAIWQVLFVGVLFCAYAYKNTKDLLLSSLIIRLQTKGLHSLLVSNVMRSSCFSL
jgi:hypothetical protein